MKLINFQANVGSVLRDNVPLDVDFEHCRHSHDDTHNGNGSNRTRSGEFPIIYLLFFFNKNEGE